MTISDALPVQFWVNGVETYNQKEVCGITPICFCQPFNCDDEIRIQFTDSTYTEYQLAIYDSSSTLLTRLDFTEISPDVFELSFVPSELLICDESVRLVIQRYYEDVLNGGFTTSISFWSNVGSGTDWSWSSSQSGSALVNIVTAGGVATSKYLTQDYNTYTGVLYTLTLNAAITWASGNVNGLVNVYFSNGSSRDLAFSYNIDSEPTSISATQNFTALNNYDKIEIYVVFTSSTNPTDASIYIQSLSVSAPTVTLANSDCLDIKTSHDCTALIRYDNDKDFAGLEYSSFSPTAEFYLRIPAVFFHERNTEEEENFEESTENIVRLRNEIKLKKLLEVGFMPDYMHRKLLLILAHDTVEIDGESWIKRDPYEKEEPGNKRYPLKKASVLLTQKDYIKRNIL